MPPGTAPRTIPPSGHAPGQTPRLTPSGHGPQEPLDKKPPSETPYHGHAPLSTHSLDSAPPFGLLLFLFNSDKPPPDQRPPRNPPRQTSLADQPPDTPLRASSGHETPDNPLRQTPSDTSPQDTPLEQTPSDTPAPSTTPLRANQPPWKLRKDPPHRQTPTLRTQRPPSPRNNPDKPSGKPRNNPPRQHPTLRDTRSKGHPPLEKPPTAEQTPRRTPPCQNNPSRPDIPRPRKPLEASTPASGNTLGLGHLDAPLVARVAAMATPQAPPTLDKPPSDTHG
nr:proline-rich receptor-like protein kinase PERK9 [Penaeus vannamei]